MRFRTRADLPRGDSLGDEASCKCKTRNQRTTPDTSITTFSKRVLEHVRLARCGKKNSPSVCVLVVFPTHITSSHARGLCSMVSDPLSCPHPLLSMFCNIIHWFRPSSRRAAWVTHSCVPPIVSSIPTFKKATIPLLLRGS